MVAVAVVPVQAYTAKVEEWEVCGSERVSELAAVENRLTPANGTSVTVGTAITFSSESTQPLSFAVASSSEQLSSPDIDSGPGSASPGSGGTQRYSFSSTKAAASPRTVYWQASFSTQGLTNCAHQPSQTVTTAVRTFTVLAPSSGEAEADTKAQEQAAAKKKQEEATANNTPRGVAGGVSLDVATVPVGSAHEARVKLTCAGTAICSGRLTLATMHTDSKGKHDHVKPLTIGTSAFSLSAGKTQAVSLKLTARGRALLRAGHGRLDAGLTILKSSPAPSQTHNETVRLVQQRRS